jgi:hypothetical protein
MKYLLIIIISLFSNILISKDSIRVYCVGYFFKGEEYMFRIDTNFYYKNTIRGLNGFSFWVYTKDSFKNGELLDITYGVKYWYNCNYKWSSCEITFQKGIKYYVLKREFERKRKFPLSINYFITLTGMPDIRNEFWDPYIIYPRYRLINISDIP